MFQNHVGIDDVSSAPHLTKEGLAFEFLWARLLPAAQGEAKNTAMTTSNIVQELQERNHGFSFFVIICHIIDSHPWTLNACPLLPHPIIQNALTHKGPVQTFFQINEHHGTRYFEGSHEVYTQQRPLGIRTCYCTLDPDWTSSHPSPTRHPARRRVFDSACTNVRAVLRIGLHANQPTILVTLPKTKRTGRIRNSVLGRPEAWICR